MHKNLLVLLLILGFSSSVFASIELLFPVNSTLSDGSSIQIGSVSPNQTFELIFSDNSGFGFEWNRLEVEQSSLPPGWEVISLDSTDTSMIAKIKVPRNAKPNFYVLKIYFSNVQQPSIKESINARVVVKDNLLDVSFVKQSKESFSVVGGEILYKTIISNSSIAPFKVKVISSLPSNWFAEKTFEIKPNDVEEFDLIIVPQIYGKNDFSFQAETFNDGVVVKSFSSELNVRPTLKGKFSSAFSGFPFFTFSLLPFQLIDSYFSLILPA